LITKQTTTVVTSNK